MFLNKLYETNPELIQTTVKLHQEGSLLPDTFVLDYDTFLENAKAILNQANKENIELYYMLKQLGRVPMLGKALEEIGYRGAVVVDYREALVAMKNGLHISHIGHLVQVPTALLRRVITYGCDYITIYSLEKLRQINQICEELNCNQKVIVRVTDSKDRIYSGQTAGFWLSELDQLIEEAKKMNNITIAGVDSFPCFLYDENTKDIESQPNLFTVLKAKEIFEQNGIHIENVNAPSTTCVQTLKKMEDYPITSAEPGHGLTGTTPYHVDHQTVETPCVCYLSEVSHNFEDKGYCYGGGYYRRGHIENALVGSDFSSLQKRDVICPSLESIDYHFGLSQEGRVGESVIMSFRFQIFVTRSEIAIVKGIHTGQVEILGLFSSQGEEITR